MYMMSASTEGKKFFLRFFFSNREKGDQLAGV